MVHKQKVACMTEKTIVCRLTRQQSPERFLFTQGKSFRDERNRKKTDIPDKHVLLLLFFFWKSKHHYVDRSLCCFPNSKTLAGPLLVSAVVSFPIGSVYSVPTFRLQSLTPERGQNNKKNFYCGRTIRSPSQRLNLCLSGNSRLNLNSYVSVLEEVTTLL